MACLRPFWIGVLLISWVGAHAQPLDPRNPPFNAAPDDGRDDRAGLQRWIDAGCASPGRFLYLPPGDWHVTREDVEGVEHAGSLRITCDGLTVLGAGWASRIVMMGTAVLPLNFRNPANWFAIEIRANGVTIEGIAIDGSQRVDTGEQTHLIQITGPARDTELRRLHLHLPAAVAPEGSVKCRPTDADPDRETRRCVVPGKGDVPCKDLRNQPRCSVSNNGVYTVLGWFQGGDCVRTLGDAGPADGVSLTDSHGSACDRAFLSAQRNSSNLTITGNVTRRVTDQIIDLEPSGDAGVGKVIIMGNRFERGGASAQGVAAIALSGTGPGLGMTDSILISGNLLDGGIFINKVARVSVEHNVIRGQSSPDANKAVIQILNRTESVRLIGNDIERPRDSGAGPVIAMTTDKGHPVDVTIALNTLRQGTDGDVIHMAGAQDVSIVDNAIRCSQPSGTNHAAIRGTGNVALIARLIVSRNRVQGRCESLLHLADLVGAVTVTDNQTVDLRYGVRFSVLPAITPRISDNLFQRMPPANFVDGPPGMVFNGENGPVP